MIRILHTIDTTGPGGAETVFVNLINGLNRQKFESVVAIRGPGWVCDEINKIGITPQFINSKGSFNLRYLRDIIKIIRKNRIDIIQSHLFGSNLYCSLAGMICGLPVVSSFHGFVDVSCKERLSLIKATIINCGSDKMIFVSNKLKKYFIENKGIAASKSMTVYNGIDTSMFKPRKDNSVRKMLGVDNNNILIGAIGNIRKFKGYEYFLKAAKILNEQSPKCHFVIAGQGSGKLYKDLFELRNSLGLEGKFHFLGFQSDIVRVLNNLDIFVSTSTSEGFSISTIQAMSSGLPVVVTCSGGPEEILENGLNGLLVEIENPGAIAKAISHLLDNDYTNIIENAINTVEQRFTLSKQVNTYENVYYDLLK